MRLLELLVPPIVLLSSISVAQPEKVTLEIDEEESSRSTITFEPTVVHALKQPHSLDDLLQREEWREELNYLNMVTSSFKDSIDTNEERLSAEELVKQQDPSCAQVPQLLDEEHTVQVYPSILCSPLDCKARCDPSFVEELENRFPEGDNQDSQEPLCDEFVGSTVEDEELVQSVSSGLKRIDVIGVETCTSSGRVLSEALKHRYRLVETLHYTAFYWIRLKELGNSVYCLQNIKRLAQQDEQRLRDVQFVLAQLLFHGRRHRSSVKMLTQLIDPKQQNPILLRAIASQLLHTDNCTSALPFFEAASDLEPLLKEDKQFNTEWTFCRCRVKVIRILGREQKKLQRQLDELNAYNDAMEREIQLHALINKKTITKQRSSDSWLAFTHIKFGPVPGLKCTEVVWNSRKHKKLQCKITNLIEYFGAAVKKTKEYRSSLEEDSEGHEARLKAYDQHRKQREAEIAAELDKFLEQLRPHVGLKILEPDQADQAKNDLFGLLSEYKRSTRLQIGQKLCAMDLREFKNNEFFFISPISKGYPVRDLLNRYLNLEPSGMHPLPWDGPYCTSINMSLVNQTEFGHVVLTLPSIQLLLESPELYSAESDLLPYVADLIGLESTSDLMIGDFGQRVKTLMQFKIGPEWLHRELAAFFFRCLGLFREAFDCLAQNLLERHDSMYMTLSQFYSILQKAGVPESDKDKVFLLRLAYELNDKEKFKDAGLRYQLNYQLKTIDTINYLWEAFELDPSRQPILNSLKEYYCNRKLRLGQPIQNKYAPICCWNTEQNIYCFKELNKEGACFKIDTVLDDDDKVKHQFRSFRCSGQYTAQSFAPPSIARFVVGFIHPAIEFRNKLINDKIEGLLNTEQTSRSKQSKANTSKVLPLDYGGYSKRWISQFVPGSDNSLYPVKTRIYKDDEFKRNSEIIRDEELRSGNNEIKTYGVIDPDGMRFHSHRMWNGEPIYIDVSDVEEQKAGKIMWSLTENFDDVDFRRYEDIIRADIPRPLNIPRPDPKLVRQGAQVFNMPPPAEIGKFCAENQLNSLLEPVSTYLSVSAKGVNIDSLIDKKAKLTQKLDEPLCLPHTTDQRRLFHGLPGSRLIDRVKLYKPEKALRDALLSMGSPQDTVDMVGARLNAAMKKLGDVKDNSPRWALCTAAALYWRVKGNAYAAVTCLIQALDNSPRHMEDVAAISLANIYHQTGFLHSGLVAGNYALQASGGSIVGIHFTIANIYASMGEHTLAEQFYYSTIALQSNFQAAKDRIIALQCLTK